MGKDDSSKKSLNYNNSYLVRDDLEQHTLLQQDADSAGLSVREMVRGGAREK